MAAQRPAYGSADSAPLSWFRHAHDAALRILGVAIQRSVERGHGGAAPVRDKSASEDLLDDLRRVQGPTSLPEDRQRCLVEGHDIGFIGRRKRGRMAVGPARCPTRGSTKREVRTIRLRKSRSASASATPTVRLGKRLFVSSSPSPSAASTISRVCHRTIGLLEHRNGRQVEV